MSVRSGVNIVVDVIDNSVFGADGTNKVKGGRGGVWITVKEQGGYEAIHITPSSLTLETGVNAPDHLLAARK